MNCGKENLAEETTGKNGRVLQIDGCYGSVLNQSYHVEYDIGFQEPDSGGERVLVEVTHVPWLAVHGHDHV